VPGWDFRWHVADQRGGIARAPISPLPACPCAFQGRRPRRRRIRATENVSLPAACSVAGVGQSRPPRTAARAWISSSPSRLGLPMSRDRDASGVTRALASPLLAPSPASDNQGRRGRRPEHGSPRPLSGLDFRCRGIQTRAAWPERQPPRCLLRRRRRTIRAAEDGGTGIASAQPECPCAFQGRRPRRRTIRAAEDGGPSMDLLVPFPAGTSDVAG